MLQKSKLLTCGLLFAFSSAWGSIIPDPDIAMDVGSFSDPIAIGATFRPINGGGVFAFYNGLNSPISAIEFQTRMNPGLGQEVIGEAFHCQSPNPFFANCSIEYFSGPGLLVIEFSGTGGQLIGIPPLLPGCEPPPSTNPDSPGCTGQGHFVISLNDNFVTTGASGGWSVARSPLLFSEEPVFTTTAVDLATPEPASLMLVGAALLGLTGMARRKASRGGPPL